MTRTSTVQVIHRPAKGKKADYWFVRLRSANGKILMHSENYGSEANATRCAQLIASDGIVIRATVTEALADKLASAEDERSKKAK